MAEICHFRRPRRGAGAKTSTFSRTSCSVWGTLFNQPSNADRSGKTSVLCPVADVVAGGVVVSAVHLSYPRSVEVHRDRRALARVSYPVDAPVAGQDRGGPVLRAPPQLPGLLQAGVVEPRAVVEALVALFEHGAPGAEVGSPGGVVVDVGPGQIGRASCRE